VTIQELSDTLNRVLQQLTAAGADDDSKLDLEILALQLKRQMVVAVFDPLKELDTVTVADVSKLPQLAQEVSREIAREQPRAELVRRITATAKMALKAAGVPIPS
jgi:hypothetical protein